MLIRKQVHICLAILVVALLPYALFGRHKKIARWVALFNGIELSLAIAFLEPLYLLTNPFIALAAVSLNSKKTNNAISK